MHHRLQKNTLEKIINFQIFLIIILVGFCLLRFPSAVSSGITKGLYLCSGVIIPSLFPFMVLSSFLVKSGFCEKFGFIFEPFTRTLFKLPGCTAGAIFMSLIGGFPVGAKMTYDLFENHQITMNQARKMMLFCINAGPAFVINAVGFSMLGSSKVGIILFASLCFTSILIGIVISITETYEDLSPLFSSCDNCTPKKEKLTYALTNSVSDAAQSIFSVCVWVIFFSFIGALVSLAPLSENTIISLNCIFEVTSGCNMAVNTFSIPMIAFILGWAGLCVHCQVLQYLNGVGVNMVYFFIARIANATVASVICARLLEVFPCDVQTFSSNSLAFDAAFSVSAPAAAVLLIMSALLILDLDTKQEMC